MYFKPPSTPLKTAELMVDTETGGVVMDESMLGENGRMACPVILSIGAVIFDPYDTTEAFPKPHCFYRNVEPKSCLAEGMIYTPSTLDWWKEQSEDAVASLKVDRQPIRVALSDFLQWLDQFPQNITAYWANAPTFDVTLLKHALLIAGRKWPFPFRQERDQRTIKAIAWPSGDAPQFMGSGTAHNALDDAMAQAKLIQAAYKELKLS